jgi:hypothetical protein
MNFQICIGCLWNFKETDLGDSYDINPFDVQCDFCLEVKNCYCNVNHIYLTPKKYKATTERMISLLHGRCRHLNINIGNNVVVTGICRTFTNSAIYGEGEEFFKDGLNRALWYALIDSEKSFTGNTKDKKFRDSINISEYR